MENCMELPQRNKNVITTWYSNPTCGHTPGQSNDSKGYVHANVHCSSCNVPCSFTIAKTWKQPKCPLTDEWIKKMWYIYTIEYYSAIKKNEKNTICSNKEGPRGYYTKWNKRKRKTNTVWYQLYVKSKIQHKWTHLQNKKTHGQGEHTCGCQEGRMEWEFGVGRCKLLYMERINNKVYCIAQRTTFMERNILKKECIYVYN